MLNIALFEPEIPPNTGNIMRLAANTGAALHLIEPLGFELDEKRLRRAGLGVATRGQCAGGAELPRQCGQRGHRLWSLAQGLDCDPVAPTEQPNRIGEEKIFDAPVYDREEMRDAVRAMVAVLSGRLRRRKLRGRLVSVDVLYPDIGEETRSIQLPDYTDTAQTLMAAGIELLRRTEVSTRGVRRLGLSLGSFSGEAAEQLNLFGSAASCRKTESP